MSDKAFVIKSAFIPSPISGGSEGDQRGIRGDFPKISKFHRRDQTKLNYN